MVHAYLGTHALANFYGCDVGFIGDISRVSEMMYSVSRKAGFNLVGGISLEDAVRGILVLKASHFSVHTLPEQRGAIVDIFTCGSEGSACDGLQYVIESMPHRRVEKVFLQRGECGDRTDVSSLCDNAYGTHAFGEFYGCERKELAKDTPLRKLMNKVVREAGFTPSADLFYQFEPEGVTGVVLFKGGHFTIHTWPEKHAAAVDILHYGDGPTASEGLNVLKSKLTHQEKFFREI